MEHREEVKKEVIYELKIGYEHAISASELSQRLGCPSYRDIQIRQLISELREEGYLIGSCPRGYYLIDSIEDLKMTIMPLKAHALSELKVVRMLQNNWAKSLIGELVHDGNDVYV
jgi:biotin operon repressor